MGEYLDQFDPNDYEQLSVLLNERLFDTRIKNGYLPEHKQVIMNVLKEALIDEDYDFEAILQDDDDNYFCLPWEWIIENRRFFEFVYLKMEKGLVDYGRWFYSDKTRRKNSIASN